MYTLGNIVDWIREVSNADWYQVTEFIFFVAGIIGFLRLALKKSKGILTRGYFLILAILLIGLVLPAIRLIIWDWIGTINVILNVLAIICLLNFLGLLFVMKQMNVFSKKMEKEERAIHIRETFGFFTGELMVHFEWEDFGGYPAHHKITGKIWIPGKKEIHFKNKSIGFSISYDTKYLVRITGAKINEATFEVTKQKKW